MIDVSLIYALDAGMDGKLETSVMIRKILLHFTHVNNKVLTACYQLPKDDNGENVGLQPSLESSHISNRSDVVDVDEGELQSIIQDCFQQRLMYGSLRDGQQLNMRLLETRLRERYIVGRKFLVLQQESFSFAGQYPISLLVSKINHRYSDGKSYFDKAPQQLIEMVRINIQTKADLHYDAVDAADIENDIRDAAQQEMHLQNNSLLDEYTNALRAIEQTFMALERQRILPDRDHSAIGEYMKNILHLYPQEYDPFIRITQLKLKHLECVWREFERFKCIEKGDWCQIPKTVMDLYQNEIDDNQRTEVQQFITKYNMERLWTFLSAFRYFLDHLCRRELCQTPQLISLSEYLRYAEDIDDELIDAFPQNIKLSQAAYAYLHSARFFRERSEREQ